MELWWELETALGSPFRDPVYHILPSHQMRAAWSDTFVLDLQRSLFGESGYEKNLDERGENGREPPEAAFCVKEKRDLVFQADPQGWLVNSFLCRTASPSGKTCTLVYLV